MLNRQDYLANKEIYKQKMLATALIVDHYPKVSGLSIHMTYHHKSSDKILMIRTINFFPASHAFFNLKCLVKGCDNGDFELTTVIAKMIKTNKTSVKGKLVCSGENGALSSDHAQVSYEIIIKYKKNSK